MKLFIWTCFSILAGSVLGANNEISFVSPTISAAIGSRDVRFMEEEINHLLECTSSVLSAGVPDYDIPSFNPLEIPSLKIDLTALGIPELTGNINLANLVLGGTMGFKATHVKGTLLAIGGVGAKIEITLLFDKINFKSDYNCDLDIFGLKVFGDGDVNIDVKNLQLEMVITARLSAPPEPTTFIYIEKMIFLPTVDKVNVAFTGLFNSEVITGIINGVLNNILTDLINTNSENISNVIEEIVKSLINNSEPGEPSEKPGLIDIIKKQCNLYPPTEPPITTTTEPPITTTTEPPITTTTEPPITTTRPPVNDCENPVTESEKLQCAVVGIVDMIQKILIAVIDDPINANDLDLGELLGLTEGTWILDKLFLSGLTGFELGKVTTEEETGIPGKDLTGFVTTIPLTWHVMELDISQSGEFEIFGMKIKLENSKCMGFLTNFKFTVVVTVEKGLLKLLDLGLKPSIEEKNIRAIFSGIKVNGDDVSDKLTNFINNDLAQFLEKHGEDIGDIIAGIILGFLEGFPIAPNQQIVDLQIPIVNKFANFIEQISTIIHHKRI